MAPLVAGELVTFEHPEHGPLEGEPEAILAARGSGAAVDLCPASGWVVSYFRVGNEDVSRSWVVLYDDDRRPRVAYAARAR